MNLHRGGLDRGALNGGELATWESNLHELLDDLGNVQESLLTLLAEKRRCLAKHDWQALDATQQQEATLLQRLEACHSRRQQLIDQAQQTVPHVQSLRQLAALIPDQSDHTSSRRVQQLSGRMRLLQHESLTNWVLAQRSLLHLAQMLEVFASGGRLKPTYGRETLPLSQGAIVDQEM